MIDQNKWLVWLNGAAQGAIPSERLLAAWDTLPVAARREVNRLLGSLLQHAEFSSAEAVAACTDRGLKPTYTPCVLLLNAPVLPTLKRLHALPDDEARKVFQLLFAVFRRAYARNRPLPRHVRHWWYGDFRDPRVLVRIARVLHVPVERVEAWLG